MRLVRVGVVKKAGEKPHRVTGAGPRNSQVWSLTQFFSVDFSKSRISAKKCVFDKRTIKVNLRA